jgi:hypothetical protein
MGREIFYCAGCGSRILPEEFESGEAIALDNQNYCTNCKPRVAPELQLPTTGGGSGKADVDSASGSSALRRAVKAPLPTLAGVHREPSSGRYGPASPHRIPAVGRGHVPGRAGTADYAGRGSAAGSPRSSNTTLYLVVGVAVAAILLFMLFLSGKGKNKPRPAEGERSRVEQPVGSTPTAEDLSKLKRDVIQLIRLEKRNEAHALIEEYRRRFPGHDVEALSKLSREINAW